MSLDRSKLQMVHELGNGGWQARCPACAESGQDRKGQHLRISPEGKFGCCVFPGDREHRKRIFALAGEHGPKAIKVRVAPAKTASSVQLDLLGRLGRVFGTPAKGGNGSTDNLGTLGTGCSDPRAYANELMEDDLFILKLIGSQDSVPSVPRSSRTATDLPESEPGVPSVPTEKLPYLLPDGTLVIPFNSPERYHWWKGGQSIRRTVAELKERKELNASPF